MTTMRWRVCAVSAVVIAAVLVLATPSAQADFDDGMEAFNRSDFETALKEWQPLAEQGDPRAQLEMGRLYISGNGVPQDDAEAARWYRLAAEQGNAEAQRYLGGLHRNGRGVEKSQVESAKWYRAAAEQGDSFAQLSLGWYYAYGQGVPRDRVLAYVWLSLAATASDTYTQQDALRIRDAATEHMTDMQIEEAEALVREWIAEHPN